MADIVEPATGFGKHRGMPRGRAGGLALVLCTSLAMALPARADPPPGDAAAGPPAGDAASTPPANPLRFALGQGSLTLGFQLGIMAVGEANSFWNLSDTFAVDAGFDTDQAWGETYLRGGAVFAQEGRVVSVEAGFAFIASATMGRDVFDYVDQGAILVEDAFASVAFNLGVGADLELSGGAQPFVVGSGMLLSDAGADGFERGALIFGPRQAWSTTALATLDLGKLSLQGFHLTPNELPASDTHTVINGGRLQYNFTDSSYAGIAYGHSPRSQAPYVQAAPGGVGPPSIIADGRDGLSFWHGWFKVSPFRSLPGLWLAGDYARERNPRIAMQASGGRIEIGNAFLALPWRPTLSYGYQSFSGDNPDTPALERFDPLYYNGSQAGWASGTNGSFVFINSNIRAHRAALIVQPTAQDIVTLRYARVAANQLRSPIQFGQGTRPVLGAGALALVSGVTSHPLSDDVLVEYTHILTPNVFFTAGLGHSWPDSGLVSAAPDVAQWTGVFANLVFTY